MHTFEDKPKIKSAFILSSMFSQSENENVDIAYKEILILKEAGLISLTPGTVISFDFDSGETDNLFCYDRKIQITNNSKSKVSIIIHPYMLTDAGKELIEVLYSSNQVSNDYLEKCKDAIVASLEMQNKNSVEISIV